MKVLVLLTISVFFFTNGFADNFYRSTKDYTSPKTELFKKWVEPVWDILAHNERLNKVDKKLPSSLKFITFKGFSHDYEIPLLFGDPKKCKSEEKKTSIHFLCELSKSEYYKISIFKNKNTGWKTIQSWDGKKVGKSPISFSKKFQKQNNPYKCKTNEKKSFYSLKNQTSCHTTYRNFINEGSVASEHMVQFLPGGDILSLYGVARSKEELLISYHGAGIGILLAKPIPKSFINRSPASSN